MKKKPIGIVIISVLIITLSLMIFTNKENKTTGKLDIPSLTVDFKEVCHIEIEGYNNEANAILICNIPEFKKRQELYEKDFIENLTTFIDEYSEDEKVEIMNKRIDINSLNDSSVCKLDKDSKLKNGDLLNIVCNETIKELNYKTKNENWSMKIENLEELPPIELDEIKKAEASKKEEILPEPNLKDVASIGTLEDNSYGISPADINQHEFKTEDITDYIVLMVQEEDIEIAREKAIENGKISAIVTGDIYTTKKRTLKLKNILKE